MLYYNLNIVLSVLIGFMLDAAPQDKSFKVPEYVGETMHYKLKYGIFNIGIATILCMEDTSGYGCIIRAEAQSSGILRIIKNLNYRFECCMDIETGLPNSAIMDLKDGNISVYNQVTFDQNSRTDSTIIYSQTTGERIVPKNIYDILSAYYHFRMNFLTESANKRVPVVIQTFIADELWDLRIKYEGEETIRTMYGKLPCLKYNPSTVVGDFFHKDDDMMVWFTKDEIPIPVKIRLNLKVGSIKGELHEYQMPKHKLSNLSIQ